MKTITKRDGRKVEFDSNRIRHAVEAAMKSTRKEFKAEDLEIAASIAKDIEASASEDLETVESIQDKVEKALMEAGLFDVAKNYIRYRQQRTDRREAKTHLLDVIDSFFTENATADSTHKENANINASSVSGAFYRIGSEGSKDYYNRRLIPEEFVKAHQEGYIHYHDSDYYGLSINCMQHDLLKMFKKGFSTGYAYITEPQSVSSAMALCCVVLQSGQTDMFGGQSIPAWDHYMEPYVEKSFKKAFKKHLANLAFAPANQQEAWVKEYGYQEHTPVFEDDNLYKAYKWAKRDVEAETYQAAQAMVFNYNSLASRSGGQVVFASINFGTCVKPGGRLASKALLKAQDDGIGKGVTSLFPITIFKLKNGISYAPGDPNYDLRLMAEKVTAKRQFPNYSNIDAPYNLKFYKEGHPETEVAYMGMAKGTETISYYNSEAQEEAHVENFEKFYMKTKARKDSLYRSTYGAEQHKEHIFDEDTYWYDVSDLNLYAKDPLSPNGRTRIKKIMCALKHAECEAWRCLKLDNRGKTETMYFTTDHPLNVVNKGRTKVDDICIGDYIVASDGTEDTVKVIDNIYIMTDAWIGYDVETESDRLVIGSISSHNCRTRVIANVNGPEIVTDRGNLSFTTLNLPRYAIEAVRESRSEEEGISKFFEKLDKYLDVAKRQLQHRFEIQCRRHVYNFPYIMGQGAYMGSEYLTSEDEVRKVLLNGTLSFGFVGLAEALVCLTGHDHSEGEEYQSLGLRIVKHMKDYADKLTATERMNWTLIGTPAESVAGRFLRIDREKFGVIPGVTDKDYYTNSCHVPVTKQIRASEKLRIEAPYHPLCNAGLITYVECAGDPRENLDALHTLINIAHDAGIGYFSFNHKVDTCTNCGYSGIIGDICPSCGQKETPSHPFMRPRRLTGYLNYENRFNSAKAAELKDRVTHA